MATETIRGSQKKHPIALANRKQTEWIVPGFVAHGGITELDPKVKAGKTMLITKLGCAVVDGLDFLGKPTFRTHALFLTEQPMASFRQPKERADLLEREDFHILQYSDTCGMSRPAVVADAIAECKRVRST